MNDQEKKGMFVLGALIGGLIGAGTVFLMATDKGKKIRKELVKKGERAIDDLEDESVRLLKKGTKMKDEFVDTLDETREAIVDDMSERIEDARDTVDDLTKQTVKKATVLKKQLFKNIPKK